MKLSFQRLLLATAIAAASAAALAGYAASSITVSTKSIRARTFPGFGRTCAPTSRRSGIRDSERLANSVAHSRPRTSSARTRRRPERHDAPAPLEGVHRQPLRHGSGLRLGDLEHVDRRPQHRHGARGPSRSARSSSTSSTLRRSSSSGAGPQRARSTRRPRSRKGRRCSTTS